MTTTRGDLGTVRAALALAARAPSVHNSQPWRWEVGDRAVDLYADLTRWLPLTDTDGRDLVLSCGAALHHLQVALRGLGVASTVLRMPDPERPDLLATVRLGIADTGHGAGTATDLDMASAITKRRTDRRRYTDWPVPPEHLSDLAERAAERGALLRVVPEGAALRTLELAVRTAALEHAAVPGYDTELALWSGLETSDDGILASAVPVPGEPAPGVPPRHFASSALPEGSAPADGATLLVLGTSSDDRLSQLRAGEATSAVLLRATTFGLASCPLSEPLELVGTRVLIRDQVLDGTLSPQIVLRVGWAPVGDAVPESPRRSLADQARGLEQP
ncbi:nitroreductase family protein [Pseudonocardia sp. RS11V-5]|uniref:Acg family FMN-binding oxidoreductase n=1 Tax=Pseudonocardia terrae TaxID=2905831 RepID=UPI001E616D0F|nr:nitroreductase family protein [Pseudonocardia terrae]MCE3553153.1 nitroreductase family protein [Pseudonocardia terrae]